MMMMMMMMMTTLAALRLLWVCIVFEVAIR
jgi:hypothetical protein